MNGMCLLCLARTEGKACLGVESGEVCLSREGPVYRGEEATDNLASLVANLYDIRQQKAALDKVEKTLLANIKPLVDPIFDEKGTAYHAGSLVMTRVEGTSRTISADLLLERGVAPDIIAYATKTTTYFQYRVKETK